MKTLINKSKVLIFDLDGTLYEDTDHFDYYARQLMKELPEHQQEAFMNEYSSMKNDNHIVSIGKGYDMKRDAVLTVDPMTLDVIEAHSWKGAVWPGNKVRETYNGPVTFDFKNIIAIGDGWWLPFVTAAHFGIADKTLECYNRTKEYMVTDQFHLSRTPGLKEGLIKLKQSKELVLMTNSDADDVERLLKELGLQGIFDYKYCSSRKPLATMSLFRNILGRFGVHAHETCSIGDNFINEVAPALKMGMNAVYIHPHRHEAGHENLAVVHTLSNAFEV
ncbi:HAD family hydrolase [Bacillus marinisedimentorum]|uniref:HAD family hydrolase n=1 Tax=Bacillus marinisedimentorum TaxID=1821260 RepID=UPI0007E19F56|nr:HAD hydrolase-like protein [Bacillus marinisedimentorum]